MAYAAISSLMYTLEQLFKPNQSFVCPSYTQQHVQSLYQNLSTLQLFLDNTTTKAIETLKACFLYVGGFPEDREINVSRLIRLWIAEQFIKGRKKKRLEVVAEEYLQELIDRSLILTGEQKANGRIKFCKIHDLLRQLCPSEAHTEIVVHVMNGDVLKDRYDQHGVILLSKVKEKHDYRPRRSNGIIRTFISINVATGFIPEVSEFKFLKVLDVLSVPMNFSGDTTHKNSPDEFCWRHFPS